MSKITLPDGQVVEDRRKNRKLLERFAAEPIASATLFTVLGVMAGGIVLSNTLTRDEAQRAADLAARVELVAQRLESCTIPTGDCYKELQKNGQGGLVRLVNYIDCSLITRPEQRTKATQDACRARAGLPPANGN